MPQVPSYEPTSLNIFTPANWVTRRKYIKNLRLQCPVMLYHVAYSGSLGTLSFLWKVCDEDSEVDMIAMDSAV